MTAPPTRPTRADAQRNRAAILEAARTQIAAVGPDVGMGRIAAAAGVAVGTLYRHFPTKTDLVAAVIDGEVSGLADDVASALERARAGSSARDEILGFLARVMESTARNHAVKAAAAGLGVAGSGGGEAPDAAARALAELLVLAQQAGEMDPSVTVADIHLLVSTAPADRPAPVRERWLDLMTAGLVGGGSGPAPRGA